MLLVCHLDVPAGEPEWALLATARRAVPLLAAQPGCRGVELGRSVDETGHWVLTARFDSVPAYRRALQPFDVREHVVPLLSRAVEDPGARPSTFETLLEAAGGVLTEHRSDRAPTPLAPGAHGAGPAGG